MTDIQGRLRTAMHAAVDHEQASADQLIRQVMRRHRRHRRHAVLAGISVLAALAVAVPAGLGAFGHLLRPAQPNQPPAAPALYIYGYNGAHEGTVTPVNMTTSTPGKTIHVAVPGPAIHIGQPGGSLRDYYDTMSAGRIVVTPDGKTAYLTTGSTVTPVNTATGTPGKPIYLGGHPVNYPDHIAITPDGKTAYVTAESGCVVPATARFTSWATAFERCAITVTPISTATGTPGKTIYAGPGGINPHCGGCSGGGPFLSAPGEIVITPDGGTAYVTTRSGVTPISTATGIPGKPIPVDQGGNFVGENIAVTPDGRTVYVATGMGRVGNVTPISTVTGRPGRPIPASPTGSYAPNIAITPDGKTAYVTSGSGTVTPISTATGAPGKPIYVDTNGDASVGQIAITPDGKTAYVAFGSDVTPISTATNTTGKPIHVGGGQPYDSLGTQIAITPDGRTAYVTTGSSVTPISTATNTPGKPIHVSGSVFQVLAITP
jgi:DNA-binding beta-propeller fold protein YncE